MAKRTKTLTYTSEEFEAKAQELMHMVFTMSEERIFSDPGQRSRSAPQNSDRYDSYT